MNGILCWSHLLQNIIIFKAVAFMMTFTTDDSPDKELLFCVRSVTEAARWEFTRILRELTDSYYQDPSGFKDHN